jgi:hypothetical protein
MNYRVGQKVVCIVPGDSWGHVPRCITLPAFERIYTVRTVQTGRDNIARAPAQDELFIRLFEILNPVCSCHNAAEESAYISTAFRPVISDEFKNRHVTKLIDRLSTRRIVRARIDLSVMDANYQAGKEFWKILSMKITPHR